VKVWPDGQIGGKAREGFWLEALDVNQYVGREHIAVLCSAV